MTPRRRHFPKGTTAAKGLVALGGIAARAQDAARTLRFIPAGNLSSIDPIVTTGDPIRNHGYMVYDTLFGEDESFAIKPRMVGKVEEAEDGLTYVFTLRDGLLWHDGAPVLAQDCIARIRRWGAKGGLGQSLQVVSEALEAVDDRTIRFRLSEPFPLIYTALGKSSTLVCFMMPGRIAGAVDHTTQITDATGSGPFRVLPDAWVPGSKAVYEKFQGDLPREEAPSGISGGKVVHVDRVEWLILPDQSTAISALMRDEVDWFEKPDLSLLPLLEGDPDAIVDACDPYQGTLLRFNHPQAPFDNAKVRQAVATAVNQTEILTAMVGEGNFEECKSFFFCGTPMSSGAGSEMMKAEPALARQMLQEAGHAGEKVVIISATDIPWIHTASLVVEQMLKGIGMTVETQLMDLGTWFTRRANSGPNARCAGCAAARSG